MSESLPVPTYDPFEPEYLASLDRRVLDPILRHYFRPRIIGAERLPTTGPAIFASNHSGTAFPWDGMVLGALLWERDGRPEQAMVRGVFEKELTAVWWMRPFGIDNFWRRVGGVDMTFDNYHRLLESGARVIYYPEGVPGIGKGFQRRYQLQRFSSSFIIQAARHEAPVVPIYTVNAEWVIPFNFTLPPLDRLIQKVAHVPFLPMPAGPLGVLFPWLWYLALPARMTFVVGEPLDVASMVRERGVTDLEAPPLEDMRAVAEEIRRGMQQRLDDAVARYGRRPYHARRLLRELRTARKNRRLLSALPFGWPLAFVRHERDRRLKLAGEDPHRSRLARLLRDLDLVGFYLPFGWFLLALARRWRRPPFGFRGLSTREQVEREGAFVWRLAERPLPRSRAAGRPPRSTEPSS